MKQKNGINSWLFVYLVIIMLFFTACVTESDGEETNNGNTSAAEETNGSDENNENTSSESSGEAAAEEEQDEEVTILFGTMSGEEHFNEFFREAIEENFEHINVEYYHMPIVHDTEEVIASGTVPDIWQSGHINNTSDFKNVYELSMDLTPLIDEHNFNLSSVDEGLLGYARNLSDHEGLHTIPYNRRDAALYYNKDVFDLVGVSYPEDGMTWYDVVEVSRDVTREEEGVQYRGFTPRHFLDAMEQLEIQFVDPDTDEPMFDTDERFYQVFELIDQLINIPGNVDYPETSIVDGFDHFLNEGNVAMTTQANSIRTMNDAQKERGFRWDVVTYPVWDVGEPLAPIAGRTGLHINRHSDVQQEAFQILQFLLSEEYQTTYLLEHGDLPAITDVDQSLLGANLEHLDEKNVDAYFALPNATGHERLSPYDIVAQRMVGTSGTAMDDFTQYDGDIASFLRELQEETIIRIEEEKAIQGE